MRNICFAFLLLAILLAACQPARARFPSEEDLALIAKLTEMAPTPLPVDKTTALQIWGAPSPTPALFVPTAAPVTPLPTLLPTSTAANPAAATPTTVSTSFPTAIQPPAQPTASPTARPTLAPTDWQTLPIIPTVSAAVQAIYQHGQQLGRNPHAFSKIGDCQSIATYFLAGYEESGVATLGATYAPLQATIDWFPGSFSRQGLAVKGGFNAAAVLSPLRADRQYCNVGESPVACEIRLNNPSIVLISLEEWWAGQPENYGKYLRQILDYVISQGVVPIVATKADNLEGNHLINQTIAQLAWEYNLPLWNFWAAVQPLPNHGLLEDGFHLTHGNTFTFDDPSLPMTGWSTRNLTALQALDAVRLGVQEPNP
jgi:hypothetical protein